MGWFVPLLVGYMLAPKSNTASRNRNSIDETIKVAPKSIYEFKFSMNGEGDCRLEMMATNGIKTWIMRRNDVPIYKSGKSVGCWYPGMADTSKGPYYWRGKEITQGTVTARMSAGFYSVLFENSSDKEIEVRFRMS